MFFYLPIKMNGVINIIKTIVYKFYLVGMMVE